MKTVLLRLVTTAALCVVSAHAMANTISGCSQTEYIATTKAAIADFDLAKVISRGSTRYREDGGGIQTAFTGEDGVYSVAYPLPEVLTERDHISLTFSISGWEKISYLAFGWRDRQGKFWHAKSTNPPQGTEIRETIHPRSIAFKLTQGWDAAPPDGAISSVEVFIKGTPKRSGATTSILDARILETDHRSDDALMAFEDSYCPVSGLGTWLKAVSLSPVSDQVRDAVGDYLRTVDNSYSTDADHFLLTGELALPGIDRIPWAKTDDFPADAHEYTTTRYLWHALAMSNSLISTYENTHDTKYLFPAREMADRWLSENFYSETDDVRYAWYDHGTSIRLIALLRLWDMGVKEQFDARFMSRTLDAIAAHGELLASEAFYVRNMVMRHHNHGIFQDVALFLIHEYVPELQDALEWQTLALKRMREQFAALSTKEGPVTVNAENSLGYHYGFQGLCKLVRGVLEFSDASAADIVDLCDGLERFSELVSYPDGRGPSYGDSYRRENDARLAEGIYATKNRTVVLPESGYAIVEGQTANADIPYKLVMIAPSKTVIHKHQDNLSLSLWASGLEWLIDPGFQTHQYEDPFPKYARSSLAHNALFLEGRQYSIEPNKADISLADIEPEEDFAIQGSHSAFEGAIVSRRISGLINSGVISVRDEVESASSLSGSLMFHAGEQVDARIHEEGITLTSRLSEVSVSIDLPSDAVCAVVRGRDNHEGILGWSFPTFANKVPIDTVKCDVPTDRPLTWQINIKPAVQ